MSRGSGYGSGDGSPLTQGRGLKHAARPHGLYGAGVAPHAGAWIETRHPGDARIAWSSPLTQGRGLKPSGYGQQTRLVRRPSRRGRGLKHAKRPQVVALGWSPLTQGRGLKLIKMLYYTPDWCRPSRRGVD